MANKGITPRNVKVPKLSQKSDITVRILLRNIKNELMDYVIKFNGKDLYFFPGNMASTNFEDASFMHSIPGLYFKKKAATEVNGEMYYPMKLQITNSKGRQLYFKS